MIFFLLEIEIDYRWIIALVIVVWNIITFAMMKVDKTRAKNQNGV